MGDEFRDCVFRTIMSDTSLTAIPDDKRTEFVRKMDKHKPLSKEENPLRAFFIKAGYPEDYLDKFDFTGGIAHMIHEKNTWGAASKNAFALKEAFGWTKDHPMPTSAPELTKLLIDTPNENQVANMKSALTQEAVNRMIENARVSWQILKSPETMEKVMMGVMVFQMLLQMMQSESAAGQAGSH